MNWACPKTPTRAWASPPADDKLISVERPLGIDSPQRVARILSKKTPAGATHRVLDVPVASVLLAASAAQAGLINGGFELPGYAPNTVNYPTVVPGWETSATDNVIETWHNSFGGVTAFEGQQFAELNGTQVSTLYQEASGIAAGSSVGWEFAHRGRQGVDTMHFDLTDLGADNLRGGGDDTLLYSQQLSDGNTAWGFYSGSGIVALGNTVRFSFVSVSSVGGATYGNFLDAADFGVSVGNVPEPGTLALALVALGARARRR